MTGLGDQLIGGIPGKPDRVGSSATALRRCSEQLLAIREDLLRCVPDDWHGQGADRYRQKVEEFRQKLLALAQRCDTAAGALEHYRDVLADARDRADALRRHVNLLGFLDAVIISPLDRQIKDAINKAVQDYNALLTEVQEAAANAAGILAGVTDFSDHRPPDFDGATNPLSQADIDQIKSDIAHLGDATYERWDQTSQHGIGDCYLLATLTALARTPEGRAELAKNIRWDENQQAFVVTFYTDDGPVEVVVRDTYDGGLTYPQSSAGLFDIYEKAYGQYFGWQDLTNGGGCGEAISHLTGGDLTVLGSASDATGHQPLSADQWNQVQQAMAHGQPVMTGSHLPPGVSETTVTDTSGAVRKIYAGHAYTVTGVGSDWVEVRNPWGNNRWPDASPTIRMSRADYDRMFGSIEIGSF